MLKSYLRSRCVRFCVRHTPLSPCQVSYDAKAKSQHKGKNKRPAENKSCFVFIQCCNEYCAWYCVLTCKCTFARSKDPKMWHLLGSCSRCIARYLYSNNYKQRMFKIIWSMFLFQNKIYWLTNHWCFYSSTRNANHSCEYPLDSNMHFESRWLFHSHNPGRSWIWALLQGYAQINKIDELKVKKII